MDSLRGLGGVLQVAAAVAAVAAFARVSDSISSANAQLRLATANQQQLNQASREAYAIAQRNGVAYDAIAVLYAKVTKAAGAQGNEIARSMEIGQRATSSIAAGIRVSGTNAGAAAAGVFQLSQALASGVLRGDELNSVMENIPAVGEAIARAMGRSAGELRTMGREGQLTSAAIIEALEKAQPELERMAALIPLTFGAAFQKVQNAAGKMLSEIGSGGGLSFGSALMSGIAAVGSALELLADNADTVGNIITGILVAAALKSTIAFIAAGAAVRQQAAANVVLAQTALLAARAQAVQAASSLAVARAGGSLGGGRLAASNAAANLVAANRAVAGTQAAATAAQVALGAATARAGLFGRALVTAATIGRAALALIGGPIGLAIAAVVALIAWMGKAVLSMQPIAGEAGTVGDYIMEAFSQAGEWVGKKAGEMYTWMKNAFTGMYASARSFFVSFIDSWLAVGRVVSGVAGGIAGAFRASLANVGALIDGLKADAAAVTSGHWGSVGSTARAIGSAPGNVAAGARAGYASGSAGFMGGATGESVVVRMEAIPGQIVTAISDFARNSGLREGANERAAARARAGAGGAGAPGSPVAAAAGGDSDAARARASGETRKTFDEIIAAQNEQARLAGLLSSEQEVQNALAAAREELERALTTTEAERLTAAVRTGQQNRANLQVTQDTQRLVEETVAARVAAAAEEARAAGNLDRAAELEAELRVQQLLNNAKRDGVVLDEAKVAAYRAAAVLASQEAEYARVAQEAQRALQEIADNARKAIQSAVSDGIYAALSGDIKGVKGLFKSIGQIMRRQMAETITAQLFGGQTTAQANSARVTQQAIDITTPAAQAVEQATQNIVSALNAGASAISSTATPLASAAATLTETQPTLAQGTTGWVEQLTSTLGPLGGAIGGLISGIGSLLGLGRSTTSGGQNAAVRAAGGKTSFGGKALAGAQQGMMIASLGKMLGLKTSSTGGAVGGAIGSAIPIPGAQQVGAVIGSVVGGLLKKAKTGSVTVSNAGVSDAVGSSGAFRKSASEAGNSILERLKGYAEQLGGGVGAFGDITVGQRNGNWRVNETGKSLKTKKGAVDFGDDAAAALEYAVDIAIRKGALTGLSAGIQNAITSGVASAEEAIDFTLTKRKISRQALALVDPVRAAILDVDDEFTALASQYKKFGEDTTDLEKVYLDQRQKAIDSALKDQMSSVRAFIADLKGTSLGGVSLTDQVKEQDRLFSAIESAQASGGAVDYEALNTVGRALIDATRELEGATPAFYAQVDRVMAVLEGAISASGATNVSTLPTPLTFREEVTTPVTESLTTVNNTLSVGFSGVIAAILDQSRYMVRADNLLVDTIDQLGLTSGSGRSDGLMFDLAYA